MKLATNLLKNAGRRRRPKNKRRGNTLMISLILLVVLLSLGVIVGATALRDNLVQQYGDIAVALDRLNQTFAYRIEIDPDGSGPADFMVVCEAEYEDEFSGLTDDNGDPPAGIMFVPPSNREEPIDPPNVPFPYPTGP